MNAVRIGTRGSRLALWQAQFVGDQLRRVSANVELVEIQTAGDQLSDQPLSQIGGEGLFTKEIQRALLDRRADIAVHSLKDLPTIAVNGLMLAAVPSRGPTGDVFVSRRHARFDELPRGAVVASSSIRRRAQILHRRPDLRLVDIRGNVETRLRKLDEQNFDATILAQAGLERLGLEHAISEILDPTWMLPAVGQGALGLECRSDDFETLILLKQLDHYATRQAVLAERSFLRALGGGCQVPIGACGMVDGQALTLRGAVLPPDGSRRVEGSITGSSNDAEALGQQLAESLLENGARALLG